MKIAIAAATSFEIQPAISLLLRDALLSGQHELDILITGVGSMVSAYAISNYIANKSPSYMIQAGIGGSYTDQFSPGKIVTIREEILGDVGVEENNLFGDLFDMGLMESSAKPFTGKRLVNPLSDNDGTFGLPWATGITVNEITTRPERIRMLHEKYQADIETMEGAAFHYVCLQENIPFLQVRSVSNYVGDRNKKNWMLKESIENLNQALIKIIQQIP